MRHAAPSQCANALLVTARVQELSKVQPAHVAGHGRNGGEFREGSEHLRRVAADGRLRLGSPNGASIAQSCSEVVEYGCCVSLRRSTKHCSHQALWYAGPPRPSQQGFVVSEAL